MDATTAVRQRGREGGRRADNERVNVILQFTEGRLGILTASQHHTFSQSASH